ncbi:hypothetical protein L1987_80793 [Smallanthus sonchifolius]|uniref:Uncharacterized protein n=1 Tax=Smallanthus sonchifolius TaxID=185202 RepID=A0ACB8YPA6_9ASTR|nr:hypothetical protein L1987_80793 [Smallanthus sonchifolius]
MEMEVIMVVAAEVVCGGYGGDDGNTCYKCGKISHMGRKCPQSGESCGSYGGGRGGGDYDGSRGGGGRCFNYKEHFSRECPNDNIHYNLRRSCVVVKAATTVTHVISVARSVIWVGNALRAAKAVEVTAVVVGVEITTVVVVAEADALTTKSISLVNALTTTSIIMYRPFLIISHGPQPSF